MAEFKRYSVTVVLKEEWDLYRRLQAAADAKGISMQEALERAAGAGIYHHIRSNLEIMERGIRNRAQS